MEIDTKSIQEAMTSTKVIEAFKKVKKLEDFSGPNGPIQMMMKAIIDKIMEAERTDQIMNNNFFSF